MSENQQKGLKFQEILEKSNYKPTEFGRLMNVDNPGQTVNNWRKRGVPSSLAVKAAAILNCRPDEISQIEVVDDKDDRVRLLKHQLNLEFANLVDSAPDESALEFVLAQIQVAKTFLPKKN